MSGLESKIENLGVKGKTDTKTQITKPPNSYIHTHPSLLA